MALKKLSITEEEQRWVRELLDRSLSHYKISQITGISRPKIWRNVQLMGMGKKEIKENSKKIKIFRWSDFENKSVI